MAKNLLLTLLATIGLAMPSCSQSADSIPVLAPQTFIAQAQADNKAIIIDVRTPDEYAAGHLPHALLIDYLNTPVFQQRIKKLKKKQPKNLGRFWLGQFKNVLQIIHQKQL